MGNEAVNQVFFSVAGFIVTTLFTSFIISRTNSPKIYHAESVVSPKFLKQVERTNIPLTDGGLVNDNYGKRPSNAADM